jgi:NADH-quinone oxidoreductase subunit K
MILKTINIIILLNVLIISIGLFGVFFNNKNFLMILIFIEIIFLGINLNFTIVSIFLDDVIGHIFILFILTIIAGESAIALSLFIMLYKLKKTINIQVIKTNYNSKI